MISTALLARVACPVCLEGEGCSDCRRHGPHETACQREYAARSGCACGGPDKVRLQPDPAAEGLLCPCCSARYPRHADEGYLDLRPRAELGEATLYEDHEFQERLRVTDAPPVLSAGVKTGMMLRMLAPQPEEGVLDLGCGAGKIALFVGAAGLDAAPFFLPRAANAVDLVLGDLRRLPFRKGTYPRAFSLDVLEHLDEPGLRDVLLEARRVIGPTGRLFVYTHAMESSRLARFQRAVNRLAARLGRAGLIDHEREALRKSDHRNPIRNHEHFDALCAGAGLEVAERRYYNVVFKAVIEDLLLRLYEARQRARPAAGDDGTRGGAPAAPGASRRPGRAALALAHALTWLLKLDVVLFGGIRTGPFFGLLRPTRPARGR